MTEIRKHKALEFADTGKKFHVVGDKQPPTVKIAPGFRRGELNFYVGNVAGMIAGKFDEYENGDLIEIDGWPFTVLLHSSYMRTTDFVPFDE